jgi:hypothetical protein
MAATTESLTTIREALQGHEDLQNVDWEDADEVWEIVAGDGSGGEGVEYLQGDTRAAISFTKTWGIWVLTQEHNAGAGWHHTWTVHPDKATARGAYIEAVQAKRTEGVTWQPDYCPIFDKLATTWK